MADNRERGIVQQPEIVARGEARRGDTFSPSPRTSAASSSSESGPQTIVKDGFVFQFVPDPLGLSEGSWERVGVAPDSATGAGRNDALSAAQAALSGFLQAQSLADARKLAAMENFMKLSKFALPEGAQFAPGYEPGGLAHTLAARQGLSEYHPPAVTPRQVNPGDVAGDIPPEIRQMIGAVRAAGGG